MIYGLQTNPKIPVERGLLAVGIAKSDNRHCGKDYGGSVCLWQ